MTAVSCTSLCTVTTCMMSSTWLLLMMMVMVQVYVVCPDPGVACTDHSDCTVLGHRYGCLLYKCTDYTDPSLLSCQDQEDCCQEDDECQETGMYTCVRTYLPPHPEGFCLLSSTLSPCSSQSSCGGDQGCCGDWCCPAEYFSQWQNFSCFSHQQCRAWHTGQYCCPDSSCCMSLPDYEDYYSYDYLTGQYSEDSYTTTLGYYDYQGYTDNPFKIDLDNEDNSAFTEHVTEKEETLDFFPVKDVFRNIAMEQEDEKDLSKERESEEVDIVSLHDASEEDESEPSPDSTLHYEIISKTIYPIEDVSERNDSVEETDDIKNSSNIADINFFPSEHVLLFAIPENITEAEVTVEEGSAFESLIVESEDLHDSSDELLNFTDIADITTIPADYEHADQYLDIGSAADITENSKVTEFESVTNSIARDMGSGVELPEEALNIHVEQIIGEGLDQTDETVDNVIKEGFEITTNPVDYLFEESGSGSGDIELSEFDPKEDEVSNIKSVKVKINVKSAEDANANDDLVEHELQLPEEFVSDVTNQNESDGEELKVSKDEAILASYSGSEMPKYNSIVVLCISLLVLSLNLKCFHP